MVNLNRTTVYLNPKVHRALKVKAATTDSSISQLVNRAVLEALREDVIDLEAFQKRAKESARPLEKVLAELKQDGQL
ncbi:MAG: CopG family transcriptional regulator [bacterium (Candidatus Ratteibacteria) CG_4_10_14_3_um_filter_41_18]|uniref:CopG family transcriptional regulator n=4 Tax=Candidatus Ratteibacteria TaxID=2979319 RepID=A0A2M7YHZ3_9BACT|nr:MAG: CopG family transcriptional regulator [bacterium (Candidatus Ratteibacteria) CG01_land_8_20_14_3_00_40_19]PIW34114.1 MAG: CopG family transcriptional regulator [bacterium (Candidatus Ratteibacteria) CG15_BIG_FIL_POST_REV_8_21_14_020_41_12]PIX77311.1 MAG: CopG family transcriptional regulator [bacterium (Candidatus Ratteibacteria) CG_4_10_14_3_um_filter_41_18]PJA62599.1 MAG: CopG family transcriptional regulator [bacterium (Candidatus Ratteibacteria) CG_4_9_14_3_um_filter_41_21]HCG77327.